MKWTTTEDDLIVTLWQQGFTSSHIANELKRSRNSVIGRVHRLRDQGRQLEIRGVVPPPRPARKKSEKPKAKTQQKPKFECSGAAPTSFIASELANSLLSLRSTQCRWPFETTFCEEEREPGRPYCSQHRQVSFRAAPPRGKVRR